MRHTYNRGVEAYIGSNEYINSKNFGKFNSDCDQTMVGFVQIENGGNRLNEVII